MALVLVAGALVVFDDPGSSQVAAAPLSLLLRTVPRLLFAVLIAVVPIAALAHFAGVPVVALTLEAGALLAVATAACLLLMRRDVVEPSLPVGASLFLAAPALLLLPDRISLLVPLGPNWAPSHLRWACLLGVGLGLTALALRDPSRRLRPRS